MADANKRLKDRLVERARKSGNPKVKRYVEGPLSEKIDQAGASAGFFVEQLSEGADRLKAEGHMSGFGKKDFEDLAGVLGDGGQEGRASSDRVARLAERVAATPVENSLDGMTNEQARRNVTQLLSTYTRGFFSDRSWEAVNRIWQALTAAQLDWTMAGSQYHTDSRGVPNAKTWKFEVRFVNRKQRPTVMYGTVTAAGAGSVEDPLDRYDLTAVVF